MSDDERLAFEFLFGRLESTPGDLIKPAYLKGGDELRARAALVKLLRSRRALSPLLRHGLASLLDAEAAAHDRQFLIRFRTKGGQSQDFLHYKIAIFVNAQSGKVEAAVASAVKKFGVDRKTVFKARKEYREHISIFNDVQARAKAVTG